MLHLLRNTALTVSMALRGPGCTREFNLHLKTLAHNAQGHLWIHGARPLSRETQTGSCAWEKRLDLLCERPVSSGGRSLSPARKDTSRSLALIGMGTASGFEEATLVPCRNSIVLTAWSLGLYLKTLQLPFKHYIFQNISHT